MEKKGIIKLCTRCRTPFYCYPSQIKKGEGKFCSTNCSVFYRKDNPRKTSEETKQKIRLTKIGNKNPRWLGDNISSYQGLHSWIRRRLVQPERCPCCLNKYKTLDIANISQKYKRDLNDWEWLCRRCHMKKDGRLKTMIKRNKLRSTKA